MNNLEYYMIYDSGCDQFMGTRNNMVVWVEDITADNGLDQRAFRPSDIATIFSYTDKTSHPDIYIVPLYARRGDDIDTHLEFDKSIHVTDFVMDYKHEQEQQNRD